MPGIWERVRPTGPFEPRMPILPLKTELLGYALGHRTLDDMKTVLEETYRGENFTVEEMSDIGALASKISRGSRVSTKLEYAANLEWALMAAEIGQITEAEFRSVLEI